MSSINNTSAKNMSKTQFSNAPSTQTASPGTPTSHPLSDLNSTPPTTSSLHHHTPQYIPISRPWSTDPTITTKSRNHNTTSSLQPNSTSSAATEPHEGRSVITKMAMQRRLEESTREESWNGIAEYMVMPSSTAAAAVEETDGDSDLVVECGEERDEMEGRELRCKWGVGMGTEVGRG